MSSSRSTGSRSSAARWASRTVAVVCGLAVIAVAGVLLVKTRSSAADCGVALEISSSTEKVLLLQKMAADYNAKRRDLPSGGCGTVHVDGFTSGAAMEALAAGWPTELAGDHPQPQVWLPTSSLWATQLRARPGYADRDKLTTDLPSVAHSPLVIAMPKEMAGVLGWPGKPLRWQDVLGLDGDVWAEKDHPEWGRFTYAKDDPGQSTSGLAATLATYYAGAGKAQGLDKSDISSEKVEKFVQQVEANVVYHPADIMDFLAQLGQAGAQHKAQSYVSAVVMQEQLTYLHNQGNPTGDPAKLAGDNRPELQMVAIHPADGTIMLNHPYVVLPSADQAQQDLARDFLGFLREPQQRKGFADLGFRDDQDKPSAALAESLGFRPEQRPSVLAEPSAEVMDAIYASWKQLSKRANVLVVVDESGSMKQDSGIPGVGNRMAAAKAALTDNMKLLNPEDHVGLWGFASYQDTPYQQRMDPGEFGDGKAFAAAIGQLQIAQKPHDDTALCVTVREAYRTMAENADPTRINAVVVLTDGKNDYPADPCDVHALSTQLANDDPEHKVKIFSIGIGSGAAGEGADMPALNELSHATGASAVDATSDPRKIDNAFSDIFRSVSTGG